jgi:hypothetical protein
MKWTERETLDTTISTIELAYIGHMEELRWIHGIALLPSPEPEPTKSPSGQSIFAVIRAAATPPPGMR